MKKESDQNFCEKKKDCEQKIAFVKAEHACRMDEALNVGIKSNVE